jgi:hypothetical protein
VGSASESGMEGNVIGKTFNVCLKLKRKREKEKREEVGGCAVSIGLVWIVIGRPARDPSTPPNALNRGRDEGSHYLPPFPASNACASVQHAKHRSVPLCVVPDPSGVPGGDVDE